MAEYRVLGCDGCTRHLTWPVTGRSRITKAGMEQGARDAGWQAPDKLGRHWCPACRKTPAPAKRPRKR